MHEHDHRPTGNHELCSEAVTVILQHFCERLIVLPILVATLLMSAEPASADKRVALVIGNGAYLNAAHLPNPPNDARDVAEALKRSGFEAILGIDLDKAGMDAAAVRFARAARDADVAMFYYSGHAMQYGGINYLLPIDAKLTDEADLRLLERVDDLVADLQRAKSLRILVLDSCRDNPFADELKRSIGTTRAMSVSRGLAKIDNPEGLIVSYATQAGRTAEDGTGHNSPFTTAFLKYIETPEEIGTIFRKIGAEVYAETKQTQLPELSLSLIGEFYLRGRTNLHSAPEGAAPSATSLSEAAQAWAATKDTTSQAVLEGFIHQFGNTIYASLAQARLQELKSAAQSHARSSSEVLLPETVPYIHDSDRAVIRNIYMSAPDHKALAISFTQIGFISGQSSDEAAEAAAIANCQRTTETAGGIAANQRCELYALGNNVVYAGGPPPLPPMPWVVHDPAIERPYVVSDVPIVNEHQRAFIAKCYPDVGHYSKALAISPRGTACYRNQKTVDEAIRRALETCGHAGVPCLVVAVDDKFVLPIPTTMKAIGLFRPIFDATLAANARDEVARKLANASNGWNAVAVGENGQPGMALRAVNEPEALDAALTDCGKHDQNCHIISVGPFLVAPKSSPQSSAGSGQTQGVPHPSLDPCRGVALTVSQSPRTNCPLLAAAERALKPKDSFRECDRCPTMLVVPAGVFTMGSPESERIPVAAAYTKYAIVPRSLTTATPLSSEGPQHHVTIARPFAAGKFAVTFDEWDACVDDGGCNGYRPSDEGWGRGSRPVVNVNWDDAQAYVRWLSRKTGKGYQLLSEAEWEYIARASTTTPYWWGSTFSTNQANYNGTRTYADQPTGENRKETLPVASFSPNPWGFYQVHGNSYDWTEDCFHDDYFGAPADGSAWMGENCKGHVARGGAWSSSPWMLRCAFRAWFPTDFRSSNHGFRLARTLTP
jgi:formylglycine-generating enzyme required for sulfatase activity/uncharacterized caspase-like protein